MIRFICICIVVGGFLILAIPLLGIEWLIGKFNPRAKDISSLRIVQAVFRLCIKIAGVELTLIGEENIPQDQPVLYIGNHRSQFDILLTYTHCKGLTGFVAKSELEKIPLLRNWMRYLHCLFLDRTDIKKGLKTILTGIEKIKSGISICIFPEGTRNKVDGEMLPFKEGSMKMAEKTGCLVVPVALSNTAEIFENHVPWIRPCKVVIEYGLPIDPQSLSRQEQKHLGAMCRDRIQEMLDKNAHLIESS